MSFLSREISIGMNKIFLGFEKFQFYPKYYTAINRKVVEQSVVEIRNLNCVKFIGNVAADNLVRESALTYLVDTTNPPARFSTNISNGIHEGWTVTYAALQIAYFLGFKQVIIIGLDHRYKFEGKPNEAHNMEGDDPNHFDRSYFAGRSWDNPDLAKSEESYRIARKEFEADGRQILDATVDGACDVFEKVNYQSLFNL